MSDYLRQMEVQYGVGLDDASTALPTKLPDSYSDPLLRPSLAPAGRELEEYRVRTAAHQMGLDPDIAAGVAFQESGFDPKAVSPTGVRGTMQVTKPTAVGLGYNRDIPDENIRAGIALLKKGMDKHPDNMNKALRGYPAPKDRKKWIPSVLGHSIKAKENREKRLVTIEDIDIPEGMFDVSTQPLQEASQEAVQAPSQDKELDLVGRMQQSLMKQTGLSERDIGVATTLGMGGEGIAGGAVAIPRMAGQQIMKAIPALQKLATKSKDFPKIIKGLLGLGKNVVEGASVGALVEGGFDPEATPSSVATSAIIGGAIPVVLKPIVASVKALANKAGDITIGKTNIGKWINKVFGWTKSMKSLANKNKAMYAETEKRLQETLNKYGKVNVKIPKDTLTPDMVRQTAKEAISDRAPQEVVDQLNYLADRLMQTGHLQPYELNVIKRALYTDAYSATGKMKGSAYAKNTAKIANKVKKLIEDNTDDTVRLLNEQEAKHIALTAALNKQMSKKPSAWSLFAKVVPAVTAGGGAGAVGGPVIGGATTAAMLAGQTVPGFTGMGAAGSALENPELLRILSTLLPQFMKQGE